MTSPLELPEISGSVMEDTVVGDTYVIAVATNHAAAEGLTEHLSAEITRIDASAFTSATTSEDKEQDKTKKKRRVTGEKRTRRVGIPAPRKYAKLEDPSHAGSVLVDATYKVHSKHDEKWNKMLEALIEYKKEHNSTMVPQCYDQDQRLGRWVHYQRGMYKHYWICACASSCFFMRCHLTNSTLTFVIQSSIGSTRLVERERSTRTGLLVSRRLVLRYVRWEKSGMQD
jgi:hypothetical protein